MEQFWQNKIEVDVEAMRNRLEEVKKKRAAGKARLEELTQRVRWLKLLCGEF